MSDEKIVNENLLVDKDSLKTSTDELYHYGRLGMKWGKNIFGDKDARVQRKLERAISKGVKEKQKQQTNSSGNPKQIKGDLTDTNNIKSLIDGYNQRKKNESSSNKSDDNGLSESQKKFFDSFKDRAVKLQKKETKETQSNDKSDHGLVPVKDKNKKETLEYDEVLDPVKRDLPKIDHKPSHEDPIDVTPDYTIYDDDVLFDVNSPKSGSKNTYTFDKKNFFKEAKDRAKKEKVERESEEKIVKDIEEELKKEKTTNEVKEKTVNEAKEKTEREPEEQKQKQNTKSPESSKSSKDQNDVKEQNKKIGRQIGKLNQQAKVAEGVSKIADNAGKATKVLGRIDNDKRMKQELDTLDNAELRKINERLQLETTYKNLNKDRMSDGYTRVHNVLNLAVPVASLVGAGLSAYAQYKELFKK